MEQNLQFISNETEAIGQQIKWMETDSIDLDNILKLLKASQENEENTAVKNVLDICIDKIENLISIEIPEVNKSIKKIMSVINELELNTSKAPVKRRSTKKSSNNSRTKSKPEIVKIDSTKEPILKEVKTV